MIAKKSTSQKVEAEDRPLTSSASVPFGKSKASVSLDALRGAAALLVLADHCRHFFFVEYHDLGSKLYFLPYLVTVLGHQAVVIFFVLSGFLVGGSALRSVQQDRWSWKRYLTHRFVRLWLVLIPALLACMAWDSLGSYLHSHAVQPTALLQHIPGVAPAQPLAQRIDLHPRSDGATFFGNVFFVQTILVPTFGTNEALWSLANEFWYYILFPLGLLAIRSRYSPLMRVLYALAFLGVCLFVGKSIVFSFPLWILGAVLIYLPAPRTSFALRASATVVYAIATMLALQLARTRMLLSDYILAILTTAYIWLLLGAKERSSGKTGEKLARGTARFSYTLYLTHMPLMIFLAGLTVSNTRWFPNSVTVGLALAFCAAALLYAWIFACFTEFKAEEAKQWAERIFVGNSRI